MIFLPAAPLIDFKAIVGKARPLVIVGALSLLLASTLPPSAQAQAIPDNFKILPGILTPDQKTPLPVSPTKLPPLTSCLPT